MATIRVTESRCIKDADWDLVVTGILHLTRLYIPNLIEIFLMSLMPSEWKDRIYIKRFVVQRKADY